MNTWKIIFSTCFAILATINIVSAASITQLKFVTEPRLVPVSQISEAITVQLQNSSAGEEKLNSTADVNFETSSATGEFLGSTGKPATKTMSTGSANRTFYYRDSTSGEHTLNITVTLRSTGESFSTAQKIYVGIEKPDVDDDEDSTNNNSAEITTKGSGKSAVAGKKPTNYKKKISLQSGAGDDRVVLVNTPVEFEAEINKGTPNIKPKMDYYWTFGDGGASYGREVEHIYREPGEYNVVLVVSHRNEKSISRIKVKVLNDVVSIVSIEPGGDGYVELKNNSNAEIDLGGWEMTSADKTRRVSKYIFPKYTLIGANKSIRVSNSISYLNFDQRVTLSYPEGGEVQTFTLSKPTEVFVAQLPNNFNNKVIYKTPVMNEEPKIEDKKQSIVTESVVTKVTKEEKKGFWNFVKSLFTVH